MVLEVISMAEDFSVMSIVKDSSTPCCKSSLELDILMLIEDNEDVVRLDLAADGKVSKTGTGPSTVAGTHFSVVIDFQARSHAS